MMKRINIIGARELFSRSAVIVSIGFLAACSASSSPGQESDAGSGDATDDTKSVANLERDDATVGDGGLASGGLKGTTLWRAAFDKDNDYTNVDIAVDPQGMITVVGHFTGTINLGGSDLQASGFEDIFVARFDSAGKHLWSKRFGVPSGRTRSTAVAVDASGHCVITGTYSRPVDFGGGAVGAGVTVGHSVFVARFDGAGQHRWSKAFRNLFISSSTDIAIDATGDIVVAGYFRGGLDFGTGKLDSLNNGRDGFLLRLDSAGTTKWSKRLGDRLTDSISAIAVAPQGDIVVTGRFGRESGSLKEETFPKIDVFVARFDSSGTEQWLKRFPGDLDNGGESITVDGEGNVVVAGLISKSLDFGGGPLTVVSNVETASFGSFVVQFDSAGSHRWSLLLDRSSRVQLHSSDDRKGTIVAGIFGETMVVGDKRALSSGGSDVYILRLDREGAIEMLNRYGSAAVNDSFESVALGGDGGLYLFRTELEPPGGDGLSSGTGAIAITKINP